LLLFGNKLLLTDSPWTVTLSWQFLGGG